MSHDATWVIGTAEDCDLCITDDYAARHHCKIERRSDRYTVQDLGSTNGTYLKIRGTNTWVSVRAWVAIHPGDIIRVGRTEIPWKIKPGMVVPA